MGFQLFTHRFEVLDSTNAKARDLARGGAGEGTVIIAERQTAGRGRGKNAWHSPSGGLYYSVLLRAAPNRAPTDLPILAGVCLAQSVKEMLPKQHDIGLKWPNDCLLAGKKVGGILCEALGEEGRGLCVVGMGLNVNTPPEELSNFSGNPFGATSFSAASGEGSTFDLEEVARVLTTKLGDLYAIYHRDGFNPIRFLWERNCRMLRKSLEIKELGTETATRGVFEGIDDSGALMLSTGDGNLRRYLSGEITCSWS